MAATSRKVQSTKNYRLFTRSEENRQTDIKKHKALMRSMRKYGFLPCFPIVCVRDEKNRLVVKDGQHRLAIAETLGLPVHWIEEATDFDVATINSTAKVWTVRDYAERWLASGKAAYGEAMEFAEQHRLPLGIAFAMLGGVSSFNGISDPFMRGDFRVKDREWADAVAATYGPITKLAPATRNARFLAACMAACRIPDFDVERFLANARRCQDKLGAFSTRDAYLDMMETVYNFNRQKLVGLKAAATMAMRERSFVHNPEFASNGRAAGTAEASRVRRETVKA
jgi:hypothetical protein